MLFRSGEETLVCLFNFTGDRQEVALDGVEGRFTDLITGEEGPCSSRELEPYQYCFCLQRSRA